jgi:hypothetical protein
MKKKSANRAKKPADAPAMPVKKYFIRGDVSDEEFEAAVRAILVEMNAPENRPRRRRKRKPSQHDAH